MSYSHSDFHLTPLPSVKIPLRYFIDHSYDLILHTHCQIRINKQPSWNSTEQKGWLRVGGVHANILSKRLVRVNERGREEEEDAELCWWEVGRRLCHLQCRKNFRGRMNTNPFLDLMHFISRINQLFWGWDYLAPWQTFPPSSILLVLPPSHLVFLHHVPSLLLLLHHSYHPLVVFSLPHLSFPSLSIHFLSFPISLHNASGRLPWQGLKATYRGTKYRLIQQSKQSTLITDLCAGLPEEFAIFLVRPYARVLSVDSYW